MTYKFIRSIAAIIMTISCSSCDVLSLMGEQDGDIKNVMLLYSAGYNNLASYLKEDIKDLKEGWLPTRRRATDVVLVYSHFPQGGYNNPTHPTLVRLSRAKDGKVVCDTLVTYPKETVSSSAEQLNTVLTYIRDNYDSERYGMIFSSHATGYLPAGYYLNEDKVFTDDTAAGMSMRRSAARPVLYVEPEYDPSLPLTKSIGQDQVGTSGAYVSYEMELSEFASAIPMYLDYILFDACLMGGVEVTYELRDKVGKVGFSQAEVLAEGFCYGTLTSSLLTEAEPDVRKVCDDYFQQYDIQNGVYRSATISLIDCGKMDSLAIVCNKLFDTYSEGISDVNYNKVQRFYRSGKHWFYDMESILVNAGISETELQELHAALDQCVLYKAHTPSFMSEFDIHTFCGFSMYLPNHGSERLSEFYKSLKWNQDTGLVR